jgi:hypothetical protein
MPYINPTHRVRLNKTEAIVLMEALEHALTCWDRNCQECKEAKKLLHLLTKVVYERNR